MNNLSLLDLNELIYCVGHTLKSETANVNRKTAERLYEQLTDELAARCNELDKLMQAETDAVNKWG